MFSSLPCYARLPIAFDLASLQAALARVPAASWQAHFNTGYYQGDWSGAALITPADAPSPLAPGAGRAAGQATELFDAGWRQLLAPLDTTLRSARLLRLGPGSQIREHCDPDLGIPDCDLRLHIPILSTPAVSFVLDGQQIPMQPGECWFLDLSRPHRVDNPGTEPRIHLVLDCRPSRWLYEAIQSGRASTPVAGPSRASLVFAAFRTRLEQEPALSVRLAAINESAAFIADTVELAQTLGYPLRPEDVQAAMRQGRRDWIEQWMV